VSRIHVYRVDRKEPYANTFPKSLLCSNDLFLGFLRRLQEELLSGYLQIFALVDYEVDSSMGVRKI
jgi:hypothetical protein